MEENAAFEAIEANNQSPQPVAPNHTAAATNNTVVEPEPVPDIATVDNVDAKPPVQVAAATPAPPPVKAKAKPKKVNRAGKNWGVSLNAEQTERLEAILAARQKSNLSESASHMLKQIINFAVNHEEGWVFGVPKFENKVAFDK